MSWKTIKAQLTGGPQHLILSLKDFSVILNFPFMLPFPIQFPCYFKPAHSDLSYQFLFRFCYFCHKEWIYLFDCYVQAWRKGKERESKKELFPMPALSLIWRFIYKFLLFFFSSIHWKTIRSLHLIFLFKLISQVLTVFHFISSDIRRKVSEWMREREVLSYKSFSSFLFNLFSL